MKFKITVSLILCLLFVKYSQAQNTKNNNLLIMGVPQYLLVNSVRIDIDKNIKGTNKWVVISPQIFNGETGAISNMFSGRFNYLDVKGGALGLSYKYVLSEKSNSQGVYVAAGGAYHYLKVKSEGVLWEAQSPGSLIMVQKQGSVSSIINRMGLNSIVGMQLKTNSNIFMDFYVGFGIKLGLDKTEEGGITDLSAYASDYGYSGTYLLMGVRFGIGL